MFCHIVCDVIGERKINNNYKRLILTIFITVGSLVILIVSVSFINHQIQLSKENELFVPSGKLVEVNDHQMHVYSEGNGKETLVFMSGGGTSAPVLDFKSLFSLLSDQYKIVVVEKSGYGFSDITNNERDIDTILAETREALKKSEISGPYILLPHSMSGIEALRWEQMYPDEVRAIIGLDMAVPKAYEAMDINMSLVHLGSLGAKTGLIRWIPSLAENDAIKYGNLTDDEKELYKIIFYRRTMTKNMVNEIKYIQANAQMVKKDGAPNVPMLLFSSNGEETGFDANEWINIQEDFVNKNDHATLIKLDSSHYIHNINYERIAEDSIEFIESINQK